MNHGFDMTLHMSNMMPRQAWYIGTVSRRCMQRIALERTEVHGRKWFVSDEASIHCIATGI